MKMTIRWRQQSDRDRDRGRDRGESYYCHQRRRRSRETCLGEEADDVTEEVADDSESVKLTDISTHAGQAVRRDTANFPTHLTYFIDDGCGCMTDLSRHLATNMTDLIDNRSRSMSHLSNNLTTDMSYLLNNRGCGMSNLSYHLLSNMIHLLEHRRGILCKMTSKMRNATRDAMQLRARETKRVQELEGLV
jgi:hypothetical protein